MKMIFSFLILFAVSAVSPAQAQTRNHRTHFQVLRQAFLDATIPARIQDFESRRWDRCIYVDISDQQTLHETKVRTVQMRAQDGGPLLSGGVEQRADVFNDPVINRYMFSFFKSSYLASNQKQFVQVVDGHGWARMNLYAKKDRGVLLFHVATSPFLGHNTVMDPRIFGYCWNQQPEPRPEPQPEPNPAPPSTAPAPAPRPPARPPAPVPVPASGSVPSKQAQGESSLEQLPLPLPAPPTH